MISMADICDLAATGLDSTLTTLLALASFATALLIITSFMVGRIFSNPKVTLWAKTEIIQLFVSIASVSIIFLVFSSFCTINLNALYLLTDLSTPPSSNPNVFDAAENYLLGAAEYSHQVLEIERYYLMSYNMLLMRGRYDCIYGPILCMFGNAGTSSSPFAYMSVVQGAMNVAFNTTMVAYMSLLVSLFILSYVKSAFVLLLLPLGIFFRSLPYLRSLGSLFITISFAFVIVYPSILGVFHIIDPVLFNYIDGNIVSQYGNPNDVVAQGDPDVAFGSSWDFVSAENDPYINRFFDHGRKETTIFQLAGRTFIVGVFIPMLALLATIASVSHVGRLMGEEIDLSRIVRMV